MGRKRKTTEQFIKQARKAHGDKYDYSKVVYKSYDYKVCIICPKHGDFWQVPNGHTRKKRSKRRGLSGCAKCGIESAGLKRRLTAENFIEKAKKVHGDKYDYSKVVYKGNRFKICITCRDHGEFWQNAANHLTGYGCPPCGTLRRAQKTTKTSEQFIEDARKVHGDKYNYDKSIYKGCFEDICVTCLKHGDFLQAANTHLKGSGCNDCWLEDNIKAQIKNRKTTEKFIEEAKKTHGDKYTYEDTNYTTALKKVCITCPTHGGFWQLPGNHLKNGCAQCGEQRNISESNVRVVLEEVFGIKLPSSYPSWLINPKTDKKLQLDGYNEQHKIAFEFQGIQHYEPVKNWGGEERLLTMRYRDKIKNNLCLQNDVILVRIDGRKIPRKYRKSKDQLKPYILEQLNGLYKHQKREILQRLKEQNELKNI